MDPGTVVVNAAKSEVGKAVLYTLLGGGLMYTGMKIFGTSKPKQTTKKKKRRSVAKVVKVATRKAKKALSASGNRKARAKRGRPKQVVAE